MLGEAYMGVLKQKLNLELTRNYLQTPFSFRRDKLKLFED